MRHAQGRERLDFPAPRENASEIHAAADRVARLALGATAAGFSPSAAILGFSSGFYFGIDRGEPTF
jgi:hypothetical protein